MNQENMILLSTIAQSLVLGIKHNEEFAEILGRRMAAAGIKLEDQAQLLLAWTIRTAIQSVEELDKQILLSQLNTLSLPPTKTSSNETSSYCPF